MAYKYAVVWFKSAKLWAGKVRPRYPEVKIFYKLENAKRFQKEFIKPYPNIYKLHEVKVFPK